MPQKSNLPVTLQMTDMLLDFCQKHSFKKLAVETTSETDFFPYKVLCDAVGQAHIQFKGEILDLPIPKESLTQTAVELNRAFQKGFHKAAAIVLCKD